MCIFRTRRQLYRRGEHQASICVDSGHLRKHAHAALDCARSCMKPTQRSTVACCRSCTLASMHALLTVNGTCSDTHDDAPGHWGR